MRKITKSVLCAILALVQAFCLLVVPVMAAEEGTTETVKSLAETTITEDLSKETIDAYSEEIAINESLSLIAFSAEKTGATFNCFFYLYCPAGFANVTEFGITVTIPATLGTTNKAHCYTAGKVDVKGTIGKFRVNLPQAVCGYNSTDKTLTVHMDNYKVTRAGKTIYIPAYTTSSEGSAVDGVYDLIFNLTDGVVTQSTRTDTLKLDVTLVSERVSTPTASKYTQINTAMMLIPNSYFDRYGEVDEIEYIYSLYDKVPMGVIRRGNAPMIMAGDDGLFYFVNSTGGGFDPRFKFYVDSISETAGTAYDVSGAQILEKFHKAKQDTGLVGADLASEIHAADCQIDVITRKKAADRFTTESYAGTADFWQKLFDGTLFRKYEDDSVDLANIQVFDLTDITKTNDELSEKYVIDGTYIPALRTLAGRCASGYQLVLLRYLNTDYIVYPFSSAGYSAENAIIDDFQILKLIFAAEDEELGTVKRTTVYTENEKQTFIDGLESPGKLQDEISDSWLEALMKWLKKMFDNLFKILLGLVIAFVVVVVIRLISGMITRHQIRKIDRRTRRAEKREKDKRRRR